MDLHLFVATHLPPPPARVELPTLGDRGCAARVASAFRAKEKAIAPLRSLPLLLLRRSRLDVGRDARFDAKAAVEVGARAAGKIEASATRSLVGLAENRRPNVGWPH
jgi:hypothetical protein